MIKSFTLSLFIAVTIVLSSCTTTDPRTGERKEYRTGTGALIGAGAGAALGKIIGDDTKAAIIGAGVGALAGAAVGNYMDSQEQAFRQDLEGTGVEVEREGDTISLLMPSSITFDTGRANIKPQFYPILDNVGGTLAEYESTVVHIAGHTDSVGSAEYNHRLSINRANSVRDYLIRRRVIPERIVPTGYGESMPIADNSTESGRMQNRRVEITLEPLTR